MTPEQRQLAQNLVICPPSNQRRMSKQDFAVQFPEALDDNKLALSLLDAACNAENAEDLQCTLIIGHVFGFSSKHEDALCRLVSADWHVSHEDVVSALAQIEVNSEKVVDALYDATQTSLSYLEYDSSRALAVKAIWALGKIPGCRAESKLKTLASSANSVLRENAANQLKKRGGIE
jgi:hypothetical protein